MRARIHGTLQYDGKANLPKVEKALKAASALLPTANLDPESGTLTVDCIAEIGPVLAFQSDRPSPVISRWLKALLDLSVPADSGFLDLQFQGQAPGGVPLDHRIYPRGHAGFVRPPASVDWIPTATILGPDHLANGPDLMYSLALAPDGSWVAMAGGSSYFSRKPNLSRDAVHVLDSETGMERMRLHGHTDTVLGMAISTDGKVLYSCSSDMNLRAWDPVTGSLFYSRKGSCHEYKKPMERGVFSIKSNMLAVALLEKDRLVTAGGRTLALWKADKGKLLSHQLALEDTIAGMCGAADRVCAWSRDANQAGLWRKNQDTLELMTSFQTALSCATLTPDGKQLFGVFADEAELRAFDARTGQPSWSTSTPTPPQCLTYHQGRVIGVSLGEGRRWVLQQWDAETGQPTGQPVRHETGYLGELSEDWRKQELARGVRIHGPTAWFLSGHGLRRFTLRP